ncbi:hypothetical protein Zm00014a_040268 [Zea mays]|uniref:Uncharacterized protein n=1 Tax=Zea mays TaxID=4577 RepID=A0A3L6FHM4_MAIZE|nr:hypothetical protein Zm00014a_040268 [Zea mays]
MAHSTVFDMVSVPATTMSYSCIYHHIYGKRLFVPVVYSRRLGKHGCKKIICTRSRDLTSVIVKVALPSPPSLSILSMHSRKSLAILLPSCWAFTLCWMILSNIWSKRTLIRSIFFRTPCRSNGASTGKKSDRLGVPRSSVNLATSALNSFPMAARSLSLPMVPPQRVLVTTFIMLTNIRAPRSTCSPAWDWE